MNARHQRWPKVVSLVTVLIIGMLLGSIAALTSNNGYKRFESNVLLAVADELNGESRVRMVDTSQKCLIDMKSLSPEELQNIRLAIDGALSTKQYDSAIISANVYWESLSLLDRLKLSFWQPSPETMSKLQKSSENIFRTSPESFMEGSLLSCNF